GGRGRCWRSAAWLSRAGGPSWRGRSDMKSPRRAFLQVLAGAAALPVVAPIAFGQSYPSQPVRWIVGFTPGGATDVIARLMGQWLSERLRPSLLIEKRPRARSNIAPQGARDAPRRRLHIAAGGSGARGQRHAP